MKSTPTLVIPDVHQNHDFLNRILAAERVEDFEHVVFLGDIFDSRDIDFRGPESAAKTATILKDMRRRLGSKLVLLYGNHDVPYFAEEAFRANGTLKKGYAHWALQEALRKARVTRELRSRTSSMEPCVLELLQAVCPHQRTPPQPRRGSQLVSIECPLRARISTEGMGPGPTGPYQDRQNRSDP